jgi:transmembrane sensor
METDDNTHLEWRYLSAYFSGTCSPEERAALEQWIDRDPARRASIARLQHVWSAQWRDPAMPAVESKPIWDRLTATTGLIQEAREEETTRVRRPLFNRAQPHRSSRMWYPVLVAVAVLIAVVTTWQVEQHAPGGSHSAAVTTYATADGQRATIMLPDSSVVILNVASRLQVPADYTRGNHTLHLDGEALFTVTHHSQTPFTVVAGASTTRVLGTSFAVRHYQNDPVATVAVQDGKVAVRSVILTAQEQVRVPEHGTPVVTPVTPGQFSFATGVLTLSDMPLSQAIAELDRWYDTDIRLTTPSVAALHIKGKFAAGSLADLQEILELALPIRIVRDGRTLTLYPRS